MSAAALSALKHPGVKYIFYGWTFFITENLVMSHNREYIINNYTEKNYHYAYNTLSTTACASIGYGFLKYKNKGPTWPSMINANSGSPRMRAMRAGAFTLHALGLVGLSQMAPKLQMPIGLASDAGSDLRTPTQQSSEIVNSDYQSNPQLAFTNTAQLTAVSPTHSVVAAAQATKPLRFKAKCPMDFKPADVPAGQVGGMERISRHPSLWALAMLTSGSALLTPFIAEACFYLGFGLFAIIGTEHQDYRYRRGSGGELSPEKEAITSNMPFMALITGRQDWGALFNEMKWSNATIATGLVVLRHLRL
ncbi:hypothetical protein SARC_06044 [Sphaeroforma arctica JP610]|uniref:Uncharacterized protein n=1 Tax=Sphaeroforma arctica JP610 TaxID=667725 RepID=A0A0L0FYE4_9EUKA|nr:hypothetical protein SARC_06044 [Sphaeroforma arctica JP610]KNC81639.1 hypothetical protein SARC_06044 [Sphaeroforma arctica JP610]|eukprot:XP_014155541.1 hypothetical protein SARC_06044 [Sphaeroforma arctica JP610]